MGEMWYPDPAPRLFQKPAPGWLWRMLLHRHRNVAEAIRRHEMYNRQLELVAEGERRGDTFVIAPDTPLPIGRVSTDRKKMLNVYQQGCDTASGLLGTLMEFLKSNP